METSTGKTGTWIKLSALVMGDELNDGSIVTTIHGKATEKSVKITVRHLDRSEQTYRYTGRNVLVVR